MSLAVDVDEADVAVLSQNLNKSKELFQSISKSLTTIASKSTNASKNIKPVLRDVNKLNDHKRQVENGLNLLKEVNESAVQINNYENILNNPIELIGLRKFIDTLEKSKALFKVIKPKFKKFTGILINFENLIDKSDIKLQTFFQSLINQEAPELLNDPSSTKIADIKTIFRYFGNDLNHIFKIYGRTRGTMLFDKLKQLEPSTEPRERPENIPYEKGTNGITNFTNVFVEQIDNEIQLLQELNLPQAEVISPIVERSIGELYNHTILYKFNHFFKSSAVILSNDILVLEFIECIIQFSNRMDEFHISNKEFDNAVSLFITKTSILFKEYIKLIESRFQTTDKITEVNIPQIIVDLFSKVRRISEFPGALIHLISNYKLGDWLVVKPPVKFVSVYTSVIPNTANDESAEYLLSSFYSDVIDSIMINIEIGLRNSDANYKKSTQGFFLIKNLVMIETILNRSQPLHTSLGHLGMERLNKLKNRFLKLFLDDWNYASYIIIRDMTSIATQHAHAMGATGGQGPSTGGTSSGHLSNKERDQIKDLFKNFNESFEEAIRNYEKYNITDVNLRNYLSNEIKKLIINAYFKLYDKYGNSDFTKNKSKYVKYDKNQFERLLNEKL
ncbi:Cullin repeat-like-containing domain protein [Scheffersomyces xylosifermentans]|uniref:Cullin repeat-like-containing domain protein n=1 Tax=Scheffersomyces xylosifermentans TaxID=1304137 RepID=UPI00315CBD47